MLLPASALFGWLWTRVNPTAAFVVSATMSLLAAGLLWQMGASAKKINQGVRA